MKRESMFLVVFLIILATSSSTALEVQSVEASGTVYIRADGSVDPPTAPISTIDNVTYIFTGNINDSVVVERDNIVVDGAGYTVNGTGILWTGVDLIGRSNVTIKNMNIEAFGGQGIIGDSSAPDQWGISYYTSYDRIIGNNITSCGCGICFTSSHDNIISGNNITNNDADGIWLWHSYNNNIIGNNIRANEWSGIVLMASQDNTISGNNIADNGGIGIRAGWEKFAAHTLGNRIYHNNFFNNSVRAAGFEWEPNVWDDGVSGNYWSYYNTDANQDGIGDAPYVIDADNVDRYPLMGMFSSFEVWVPPYPAGGFENVDVIANFTISGLDLGVWLTSPNQYLQPGQLFLSLTPVQGQNMTAGFCRMTVPNNILNTSEYIVLMDLTPISVNKLFGSNSTHAVLYFVFTPSENNNIIIVPEFPSYLILPLFFMATLLAVIYKRKLTFFCIHR